jgi:hypothetical protein
VIAKPNQVYWPTGISGKLLNLLDALCERYTKPCL